MSSTYTDVNEVKKRILFEIHKLKNKGIFPERNLSINDDINEIRYNYELMELKYKKLLLDKIKTLQPMHDSIEKILNINNKNNYQFKQDYESLEIGQLEQKLYYLSTEKKVVKTGCATLLYFLDKYRVI